MPRGPEARSARARFARCSYWEKDCPRIENLFQRRERQRNGEKA